MADVILSVAAELDPSSLKRIRSQIESETKGKPINITVGLDTKSIKSFQAAIKAAMSAQAIPISVTVDQKSLNQAVKTTTAAFSQILSQLGTLASSGVKPGAVGGPGTPASGNAILAAQSAQVDAEAKKFAQSQLTLRKTIEVESQKTRDAKSQQAAKDLASQKADDAKKLASQEAADRASLDAQRRAAAAAKTATVDAGQTTRTTISSAANVSVADKYANAKIETARMKAETEAANLAFRVSQAASKAAAKESEFSMIKRYQQATALYQAGNIIDKLGVPYLGQGLTQVGSTMQAFPTMPLKQAVPLGMGIAATTGALEFTKNSLTAYGSVETQLTKIRNLTDSTDADISKFTTGIAALSKQTGRSQNDIAAGLYFIASSGYKGADAFKILEAATKSSVAGMGDTKVMADVLTSAMNSYGIKANDAYKVTDKFIAAVREGKAEPEALAKSLGAVMPFAREAGVSLEELLGAVSTVTLQTGNAATASTSIKQAILSMYAPTKEATGQLDMYYGEGKGASTIQKKLSTEGLSAALTELYDKSGGSIAELDRVFGNVRALAGVFQLSTGRFAAFNEITKKVVDANGLTEEGFARSSGTWDVEYAKFKQSFEAFKIGFGAWSKSGIVQFIHAYGGTLQSVGEMFGLLASGAPGGVAVAGINKQPATKASTATPLERALMTNPLGLVAAILAGKDPLQIGVRDFGAAFAGSGLETSVAGVPVGGTGSAGLFGTGLFGSPQKTIPVSTIPAGYFMNPEKTVAKSGAGKWVFSPTAAYLFASSTMGKAQTPGQALFSPAFPGKILPNQRDSVSDQNAAIAMLTEGADARERAVKAASKLNDSIASNLAASINGMISQGEKYDDFYAKYNEIVKKMEATPDYVTVTTEKGKRITGKQIASEDAKLSDLKLRVQIDEISNKIRATRKPSKDGNINARAGLIDERADLLAAARAQELADLQGNIKSRGTYTYANADEEKLRKEQQAALEQYNRGTFDTFASTFNDYLKTSTGDMPTFNALLKEGGGLMGAFAESAGLLKSTGFVTTLGEAALQAKYLRDNLTGAPLKGDALIEGVGSYGKALQQFKTDMLNFNKYITGEAAPMTMDEAVKNGFVDTVQQTGFRTPTAGGSGKPETAAEQLKALSDPTGFVKALFRKSGMAPGDGNVIEQAIGLKVKMEIGNSAEDVAQIGRDVQESLDKISAGLKIKVKIEAGGLDFWSGQGDAKKKIEGALGGDATNWQNVAGSQVLPDIVIPSVSVKADRIDTATIKTDVERQVAEIDPKPVIVNTVDISKPLITGEEDFRKMITTTMQSMVAGFTFNVGQVEFTAKDVKKPSEPPKPEERATGGPVYKDGMVTVGELGPENVWLPRGSHVFTASETTRMNAAGVPTWRGGSGSASGPSNHSSTSINVDARGAAEPIRTREQVEKGVSAVFNDRAIKRRAREIGLI